jgi:protein-S-isoprenylcysteine O-methyltransferase Ste14
LQPEFGVNRTNVLAYECKIGIEEAYLREAHGAAYVAYCQRTGRYLPRLFHHRHPAE